MKLTEGQAHDGRPADDILDSVGQGNVLLADRAYDSDAMRLRLAEHVAWACVKPMPNRKRIPAFSPFLYRYRNLVERFFNKLKQSRAIATRYDSETTTSSPPSSSPQSASGCDTMSRWPSPSLVQMQSERDSF